jgi:hypothetical protein
MVRLRIATAKLMQVPRENVNIDFHSFTSSGRRSFPFLYGFGNHDILEKSD